MNARARAAARRARRARRRGLPRHQARQRPLPHAASRARTRRSSSAATGSSWPRTGATWKPRAPLEGIEAVQAERDLLAWLGARLGDLAEAPVAFEADHVTVAGYEALSGERARASCPTTGVVAGLRAVKDEDELDGDPRARRASPTPPTSGSPQEQLVGRTEAEVAWWLEQVLHDEGADALAFAGDRRVAGRTQRCPHHHPGGREDRRGGDRDRRRRRARSAGTARTARARSRRAPLPDEPAASRTRSAASAQESALVAVRAGAARCRARCDRADARSRNRASRPSSTASGTGSGWRCTSCPSSGRSRRHAGRRKRRHRRARRLPGRGRRCPHRGPRDRRATTARRC